MKTVFAALDRVIEWAVVLIFGAIVIVGLAQVFNRYVLNYSLSWSEEFQSYGQIWLVFLAIPVAYRRGMHMGIDGLRTWLGPRGILWFNRVVDLLWMGLGLSIAIGTLRLMKVLKTQVSSGLGLPMHWVYLGLLIGAVYMILVGLRRIFPALDGGEAP